MSYAIQDGIDRHYEDVAVPASSSTVDRNLNELHESLAGLEQVVTILLKKIEPVLRPMPEAVNTESAEDFAKSEPVGKVASGIQEAKTRVQLLARRVDKSLQRLEV